MADTAVAETTDTTDDLLAGGDDGFEYPYEVSDAGPSLKKVSVTIPRSRYDEKTEEIFKEIGRDAVVPGFRRGKAPRSTVQKKFGGAVKDQVQGDLLRESYQSAMSRSDLKPLGEPEFEDPESVKMPESGDLTYTFTVEVRPDITMPAMEHLTVKKAKITIKDEHVDQALENLRNQQGQLGPVEGRGVQGGDYLFADVKVEADGNVVAEQNDARLIARGGRIAGVMVDDFASKVEGMNVGESRDFEITAPEDHPAENLKGKTAKVTVTLKDMRQLTPAEVDQPFLEDLGFENKDELMAALREQMEERVQADIQNAMRRQVRDYLTSNVQLELPEKMTARQSDRVVNRRAMTLLQRGVGEDKVRAAVDKLREGADEEAKKELAAFFILDKVAEDKEIVLDESEINGQIAMLAIERDQRPETLRAQMQKDGSLQNLALSMRESKALDALLEEAKIEEIEPTAAEQQQAVDEATGVAESSEGDESEDVT